MQVPQAQVPQAQVQVPQAQAEAQVPQGQVPVQVRQVQVQVPQAQEPPAQAQEPAAGAAAVPELVKVWVPRVLPSVAPGSWQGRRRPCRRYCGRVE
ncbi:hypothetical protein [Nocardia sp. Marseille-Q1738]